MTLPIHMVTITTMYVRKQHVKRTSVVAVCCVGSQINIQVVIWHGKEQQQQQQQQPVKLL